MSRKPTRSIVNPAVLGRKASVSEQVVRTMESEATAGARLDEVEVDRIETSPFQPRKRFNPARDAELVESIRANGIHTRLIIRPSPDAPRRYQLIAGERRLRAAKEAGLRAVPVEIRELSDAEARLTAWLENRHRDALLSWDAVHWMAETRELARRAGQSASVRDLAALTGESKTDVGRWLYIADRITPDVLQRAGVSTEVDTAAASGSVYGLDLDPLYKIAHAETEDDRVSALQKALAPKRAQRPKAEPWSLEHRKNEVVLRVRTSGAGSERTDGSALRLKEKDARDLLQSGLLDVVNEVRAIAGIQPAAATESSPSSPDGIAVSGPTGDDRADATNAADARGPSDARVDEVVSRFTSGRWEYSEYEDGTAAIRFPVRKGRPDLDVEDASSLFAVYLLEVFIAVKKGSAYRDTPLDEDLVEAARIFRREWTKRVNREMK